MAHLTKFSHTGVLEAYHFVLNKWALKSTHFSYKGMVAQWKLAVINFNQGQKLDQAKTMSGNKRFNVCFSKVTKSLKKSQKCKSLAAKPIKE